MLLRSGKSMPIIPNTDESIFVAYLVVQILAL